MPTLDQTSTARPAPAWTGDLVRQRLVEAFSTERRMPGDARKRLASTWPATPLHTFAEVMHWDDARQRVWDNWAQSKGVFPNEVSRMEEAIGWLSWLDEGERRCLAAWALASSRGLSVRAMLGKRKWSRSTFYRKVEDAVARIAERLNKQGAQVR
jgi:Domain of unknown function (DUF6362)